GRLSSVADGGVGVAGRLFERVLGSWTGHRAVGMLAVGPPVPQPPADGPLHALQPLADREPLLLRQAGRQGIAVFGQFAWQAEHDLAGAGALLGERLGLQDSTAGLSNSSERACRGGSIN